MSAWAAAAGAAPLTFNTALPVAQGEFVFRGQVILSQSGDDPSGAARDRTAWSAISVLGYGVNPDLALFGVVPYSDIDLESAPRGMRRTQGDRGLADISLFVRYAVFKRNLPGRALRLAPFAGLEVPSGDGDARDGFGRLPPGARLGSGSWDPFGGLILTYQTLDFEVDAQVSYKLNTRAGDFEFGDVVRLDGSLQYRLWPPVVGRGVPGFLYGVLETNLIHRGKNRAGGADNPNSGGASLFIVPGLQIVTKRWILETGAQVPVFQDLNGAALENGYIFRAGFRVNF